MRELAQTLRRSRQSLALALCLGLAAFAPAAAASQQPGEVPATTGVSDPGNYGQRADVQAFVNSMVARHGFARDDLMATLAHAHYDETVARLLSPSVTSTPLVWSEYRARFVETQRISGGVRFWRDHAGDLERAEKTYGVPAEIIVAIIGVETLYGRNMGKFRMLDALCTLAFDYPNKAHDRSNFFKQELEELLVMARDQSLDLDGLRGSYAGAMGMTQFMPSSYLKYGVDFDGDGKVDLRNSAADAIGSVANFLAKHGWQHDGRLFYRVQLVSIQPDTALIDHLLAAGSEPSLTAATLRAAGFIAIDEVDPHERVALIDLPDGPDLTHYYLGTHNFFVLSRYNRSYAYVMSVIELADAIKFELQNPDPPQTGNTPVDK